MSPARLAILAAIFMATSIVSVVTGSTSLITVPIMIAFGIEAHVAVATNMLALTFMSVGGSLPFARAGAIHLKYLPLLLVLTVFGSAFGASLLLSVSTRLLKVSVVIAMAAVTVLVIGRRDIGMEARGKPASSTAILFGSLSTFLLAIYGGFFSGGYVTMLTAAFLGFFGMTFHQAVATTKVANIFSSAIAAGIFLWRGMVDVRLGLILGVVMFLGAILGSRLALRMSAAWLRRAFLLAVLSLAVKMLASL